VNVANGVGDHRFGEIGIKSVRKAGWQIERLAPQAIKVSAPEFAVGRRASTYIQSGVLNATPNAVHQFPIVGWRRLKMHSPDYAKMGNGIKILTGNKFDSIILEQVCTVVFNEVATIIRCNARTHQD